MGFRAREIMRGYHEFAEGMGPPGRHPFTFRASWGPDRLRDWLDPRKPTFLWQELTGEVDADGLCEAAPCRGTLHLRYVPDRTIRYVFEFDDDHGRALRYEGTKENLRPWNLLVTHTTCFGTVTEVATGRLVSRGVTFFRLRDLPGLLAVRAA
ncbi:MAG: hypothetical protein H6735_25740 [Alphaproteobacteria bacterium]|nr:hypothetical protein [Alphaproteobacteria bacterium]